MKTVKQVWDLTGISIRMLHHYDKIGLFKPSKLSESGYRLYSDDDLEILQQILFFKELDFSLKEIKAIITNPSFDRKKALTNHKDLLILKRNRLNKLIKLVDKTLKGEIEMSFKEFDIFEIEEAQKKYAKEAKKLYCNTNEYKEYQLKTAKYNENDWEQIGQQINNIFKSFANVMDKGPDSQEAQDLVKQWQDFISKNLYECTNEALIGLGEMYIQDERFTKNIDKQEKGLSKFISKAIEIYCK